jgi:hypothetical protein
MICLHPVVGYLRAFRLRQRLFSHQLAAASSIPKTKEQHLSTNGQWQYFRKVPNLIQYVASGSYFARVKHKGKAFHKSPNPASRWWR